MTHTPGPWRTYDVDEIRAENGRGIAVAIHTIAHDLDIALEQKERKANARLIAAAPEMLAELVSTEQTIRNFARCGALRGDYVEIAEQTAARMAKLIAKARGE